MNAYTGYPDDAREYFERIQEQEHYYKLVRQAGETLVKLPRGATLCMYSDIGFCELLEVRIPADTTSGIAIQIRSPKTHPVWIDPIEYIYEKWDRPNKGLAIKACRHRMLAMLTPETYGNPLAKRKLIQFKEAMGQSTTSVLA